MKTCADAIKEALMEMGGEGTIREVKEYIEQKYPSKCRDVGTLMADLCRDSASSTVLKDKRFLVRIGRGKYRLSGPTMEDELLKEETMPMKESMTPFREHSVQALLVKWFSEKGYRVIEQCVDDPSSVDDIQECATHPIWGIDVVAQKNDELWILEVKGEDKGGSASGDVNFSCGIGQLLSYMTRFDDKIHYGLVIPHPSRDFKRAIKRMGNSRAFEMLGMHLFLVEKDGTITQITPDRFREFAKKLR
jgi:hypothetical protein